MSEFSEKIKTIGFLSKGRTGNKVKEFREPEKGYRMKATTDELGHTVTEHAVGDRQDVLIRAPHVKMTIQSSEKWED